jgi:DNA-binding transcriptional ArsR family regulator
VQTEQGQQDALVYEKAVGSRAAMRVLRLLSSYPDREMTLYRVAAATGVKKRTVKAHLGELVRLGLVERVGEGVITYRFGVENRTAVALRLFFAECGLLR